MMELRTPGFLRFRQAKNFEASFSGGEANVAISLVNFGLEASFVTCLPDNDLGKACISFLKSFEVDTSAIQLSGSRIGMYFYETGANQRPSRVIYDRAGSSISEVKPDSMKWDKIFKDVTWFHVTGITPALSQQAADAALQAVKTAKDNQITVSCDLNYRKKLWKYGKNAGEIMSEIIKYVDICIGNEEDMYDVFGISAPDTDIYSGKVEAAKYQYAVTKLMNKFPNLKKVAITLRGSISASRNTWSAMLYDGKILYKGPIYDITHIVDRLGGGDSFCAGLIYSLLNGKSDQEAIDFAIAASCLKHSIIGAVNLVTVPEVERLLSKGGSGRVER